VFWSLSGGEAVRLTRLPVSDKLLGLMCLEVAVDNEKPLDHSGGEMPAVANAVDRAKSPQKSAVQAVRRRWCEESGKSVGRSR